jgi:hypothetical protein
MSLYNLRSLTPDTYMIAKFDDDFNVEATYTLIKQGFSYLCDCPANNRTVITKPCRHKLMMPALLTAVDTDRFYNHDTGRFCEPLGGLTADNKYVMKTLQVEGEALRQEPEAQPEPGSIDDLLLNGNPALEGQLTGLASPAAPTIRRR